MTLLGFKFQMGFKWTSVGVSQPPNPIKQATQKYF